MQVLPEASTFHEVVHGIPDPGPQAVPSGAVVHPTTVLPVFESPGGLPVAKVPPKQIGSDTWLPVIAEQPGWVQVLLPSRPNGVSAWLPLGPLVRQATTPWRIEVDRAAFQLTLLRSGQVQGQWTVGIGKASSPTPPGRTFVMASISERIVTFSPTVLPLGWHSDTYTSYGGGPGTVGIHTWIPDSSVYGTASSDGCIRVPPAALEVLEQLPLGTPVLIR
ncbi:murein L,D-transpeptidase [Pseudonocardiaceae bacterium YIM PH 21723]|nr:murein L,D-transpeptidase [Pseudonocardiaceae bacterium YIM PH 21723]